MTKREEWMRRTRKNYDDYSDKIIIADSSPLIDLNKVEKLDYLRRLFNEVYITNAVKDECMWIDLPDWIKVEDPSKVILNLIKGEGWDDGERTAIALAIEINTINERGKKDERSCLTLDDREANRAHRKKNFGVEVIKLRDVLSFAYDKNFFNREEGIELMEEMKKKGREFKRNDFFIIFNDTTSKNMGMKI